MEINSFIQDKGGIYIQQNKDTTFDLLTSMCHMVEKVVSLTKKERSWMKLNLKEDYRPIYLLRKLKNTSNISYHVLLQSAMCINGKEIHRFSIKGEFTYDEIVDDKTFTNQFEFFISITGNVSEILGLFHHNPKFIHLLIDSYNSKEIINSLSKVPVLGKPYVSLPKVATIAGHEVDIEEVITLAKLRGEAKLINELAKEVSLGSISV